MVGKIEGKRRRGQKRMRWLVSITDSMDMDLSKLWEIVKDIGAWHAAVHRVAKHWTQRLNNFPTLIIFLVYGKHLMHWRREWQPTPVLLPGESQGLGSLMGCQLWGRTEST